MRNVSRVMLAVVLAAVSHPAAAAKLKVYILAGQSNMEGHAHVSTFPHLGMDPETRPLLAEMVDDTGKPRTCERVWISYLTSGDRVLQGKLTAGFGAQKNGPKIGPEFTFGITLEKRLANPILLIKTAWGGKSLHTDFRPPSAGVFPLSKAIQQQLEQRKEDPEAWRAKKDKATGHYYRLMVDHVRKVLADPAAVCPVYDPEAGYELAGFVWFQGWNDMTDRSVYPLRHKPGGYATYSQVLAHLIRDVRKDFSAPGLPFVIGVMGVGGVLDLENPNRYTFIHHYFRQAMAAPAAMPEFKGNVFAVLTETCWDPQLEDLDERWGKVKQKSRELSRDKELTNAQRDAALAAFKQAMFTDEERTIREVGVSNFGFHYLGSGKVMARIGRAFAAALVPLEQ